MHLAQIQRISARLPSPRLSFTDMKTRIYIDDESATSHPEKTE